MNDGQHTHFLKHRDTIKIKIQMSKFIEMCRRGDLVAARALCAGNGVNGLAEIDRAFQEACANGHESITHWLYGLGGVNVHANDDQAFRLA